MTSIPSTATTNQPETTVVDEIPEALNQILLLIVKNFFSNEHYLVTYYILRAECIREENLRNRLNFDQKYLRQLLGNLKAEKLIKERVITHKNENGRNISIVFYYVNYRAVLNVLRYKIDHMRQKLESREKDDMNRSHYKCEQCGSKYELLEVSRIVDPMTGSLKCWRCQGEVTADESTAPSELTRTSVARFNEQMNPMFARIQQLNGIQLAPHLLEPDITKFMEDEDKARQASEQLLDFNALQNQHGGKMQLGGSAHSTSHPGAITYQNGDQITVDLNADINKKVVEEAKEVPLWLQDDAIGGEGAEEAVSVNKMQDAKKSTITLSTLAEIEGMETEPVAKKAKLDEEEKKEDDDGEEEEYEEEEMVDVGGQQVALSDVTPEMVEHQMSEEERIRYTEVVQAAYIY